MRGLSMSRKPDSYAEFCALAVMLESAGIDINTIIDTGFAVAMHGTIRTTGRPATARLAGYSRVDR
jgi:hypothetical protein